YWFPAMLKTTTVRPLMTRTGSALGNVWRKSAILAQVAASVRISHCSNDDLACGYRVQYSLRRVGLMILMCRHNVYTLVRCQQLPSLRGQVGISSGSAASMRRLHLDSGEENAYARNVCRQAVEKSPFFSM